jgi:hypothetical protein
MVRRIAGITGISLWAGLIVFAAVTGLQAYCPTKKEADKIYRAVLEAHNGLAAAVVRDGNRVVEFAKTDDVELMNQARQALELPQADRAVENIAKSDINAKVAQLNIKTATLDDVIRIFGEPTEYRWKGETLQRSNLPDLYLVCYPNRFHIFIANNLIVELRHHELGYVFRGKFQVGASLNEVIKAIGRPSRIVVGKPNKYRQGVLYKDIDGKKGDCYYGRKKKGVRCFFKDYKVDELFVTCNDLSGRKSSRSAAKAKSDATSQQSGIESLAERLVNLLVKEDYAEAVKNFDETMKNALPAEKLQQVWNSVIAQSGPFIEQLGVRKEKILQYEAVFVTCKFERATLDTKVVFNSDKQVAGLFFVPSQSPSK